MLNVTRDQAVEKACNFVKEGYLYLYGYKEVNNPINRTYNETLKKLYPGTWNNTYYEYANDNIGKRAIDCSGLVCQCLGISDIGSYQLGESYETDPANYKLITGKAQKGDLLWKSGHIGIAIDEKTAVEARSRVSGVNYFAISSQPWTRIIRPVYNDYTEYYDQDGWMCDANGWWYAYSKTKGCYYHNCVALIDEKQYAFDAEGYCVSPAMLVCDAKGAIVDVYGPRWKV